MSFVLLVLFSSSDKIWYYSSVEMLFGCFKGITDSQR